MKSKLLNIASALSLFATAACVQAQVWLPIGPDGGDVNALLADPSQPGRVYAAGDFGLFRSDDAGRSWAEIGGITSPGNWGLLVADAQQPGRLYMLDGYGVLQRSDDSAASWTATGFTLPQTHNPLSLSHARGSGLFYSTYEGGLYKSSDGGATFSASAQGLPAQQPIGTVVADPADPQHLIAGVMYDATDGYALYRSIDGGASWTGLLPWTGSGQVHNLVFLSSQRLIASVGGIAHVSNDGGDTWRALDAPTGGRIVAAPDGGELLVMSGYDCRRSSDDFATSQPCSEGIPLDTWGGGLAALLVSVADGSGYRALSSWQEYGVLGWDASQARWAPSHRRLHAQAVRGLALATGGYLATGRFAPVGDSVSLFLSVPDWGRTVGFLDDSAQFIRTVAFDTTVQPRPLVYAAGRSLRLPLNLTTSGIYRSVNLAPNGIHFESLDQGLPTFNTPSASGVNFSTVRKLLLDPRSCAAPPATGPCSSGPLNVLYAISDGSGSDASYRVIRRSEFNGAWSPVGGGLPPAISDAAGVESVAPVDIEIEPGTGALYLSVFTNAFNDDGSPRVPGIASGVFRSPDGGANWNRVAGGLPLMPGSATTSKDVMALAVHPRRAGVLWAATSVLGEATPRSRIYTTTDSGANWLPAGPEFSDCDIRDLQVDSRRPQVLLAAGLAVGGTGCLWRSEDSGQSWTALHANLPAAAVYDVRINPDDPRWLVVATDHGVWTALATGDRIFAGGLDD